MACTIQRTLQYFKIQLIGSSWKICDISINDSVVDYSIDSYSDIIFSNDVLRWYIKANCPLVNLYKAF